jgi:hypothetical protein
MTYSSVTIQITPESKPAMPSWMGEVAAFAHLLTHTGTLKTIQEQVRFAHARFGSYDLVDFVAVLIGYILSGEPTLLAFYERLAPFAEPFMALFDRNRLPHRSTLPRFLAALDQPTVEALRKLFQEDLVARKPFASPGGVMDRKDSNGGWWMWMEPGLLLANVLCRRWSRCLLLIVVSRPSAHRAIRDAREEKWCARAR